MSTLQLILKIVLYQIYAHKYTYQHTPTYTYPIRPPTCQRNLYNKVCNTVFLMKEYEINKNQTAYRPPPTEVCCDVEKLIFHVNWVEAICPRFQEKLEKC